MDVVIKRASVSGTIYPPCSKSYAQRALAAALLAKGDSTICNLQMCDDTRYAMQTIAALGASITKSKTEDNTYIVTGGLNPSSDNIVTGESGLAARLFTPIAALSERRITINGMGSMLGRPVGMMIRPLTQLGVEVECNGFLPISVRGPILGGEADVDGYVSSQFLTGLLLALPCAFRETTLHITHPNSIPYIRMTLDTLRRFGVKVLHSDYREFFVEGGQEYNPVKFDIEGDWSSAAFLLAAGAVAGSITLGSMNQLSLQADAALVDILARVGAEIITVPDQITVNRHNLSSFEFDASQCPDLFPVLAALAANCEGRSEIKGVSRLVYKESNRAVSILNEFKTLGVDVEIDEDEDTMYVSGSDIGGGEVDSHGDHRIAMALAVAALNSRSPVTIRGAECVSKSYPRFWDDFDAITGHSALTIKD